ncbi:MAG: cupin-like domain-containing protein [Rhizomicrobium sp.]|nr:cupin-like domain-containing protein [Rhizomicrobium sp.]
MTQALQKIPEWRNVDAEMFRHEILPQAKPAVLRGLVAQWPAVQEGRKSPQAFTTYLKQFDRGRVVDTFVGDPSIQGRFWYRPDMRGVNYERKTEPFDISLHRLMTHLEDVNPPAVYMGSAPIAECIPDFARENAIDLVDRSVAPRIWIGNTITVSTHYDLSDNIACVVAGHRRFTLFPPEQLPNLYVGPLEFTFAGQPVSMVSLAEPDFERYPRFKDALAAAVEAELEPGDALFIPYMWWHHVQSLDRFNALVNYWWDDGREWLGSPFEAMVHGILAIGDLPPERREIWRKAFDHYVFRGQGHPVEHLAPQHRGIMSTPTPQLAKYIKAWLLRALSR